MLPWWWVYEIFDSRACHYEAASPPSLSFGLIIHHENAELLAAYNHSSMQIALYQVFKKLKTSTLVQLFLLFFVSCPYSKSWEMLLNFIVVWTDIDTLLKNTHCLCNVNTQQLSHLHIISGDQLLPNNQT